MNKDKVGKNTEAANQKEDLVEKFTRVSDKFTTAKKTYGLSDRTFMFFFLLPSLFILLFLVGYPFITLIKSGFYNFSVLRAATPPKFIGVENFSFILTDPFTWERFIFTGKFVILNVLVQFLLGIGIAYLLQKNFRGRSLVLTLILMPMMLCPIVVGLFWKYMFNTEWGIVNYILALFGMGKVEWLARENVSVYSVIIVDTWMWTPFMILLALAAFTAIPKYLYEAAEIDRASSWFKFRHITLPLSAPVLIIAVLFRMIDSIKAFDLIYTLTGGGPGSATQTLSFDLYKRAFQYFYTGEASAYGVILLLVIMSLSLIFIRYLNRLAAQNMRR
ncbi:MAG: sugar ABC transporter permease [Candidatus Atribacteria bacterium]|nr:sugar ABC transporter permease [Candidatus Atribacteria bacterium]